MELLLRIIVPNTCTEYFSGIFKEKTLKKMCLKWSTLYTCSSLSGVKIQSKISILLPTTHQMLGQMREG